MIRVITLFALVACVHPLPAQESRRDIVQQEANTVGIVSVCEGVGDADPQGRWGRGVIVTSRHVVTAAHVVRCHTIPDVHVVLPGGHHFRVAVTSVDERDDLALIELASAGQLAGATAPIVAAPQIGSRVCARSICGNVVKVDAASFDFTGEVHEGTSGTAVYDDRGALIGIVSQRMTCGPVECGTKAMRLDGHRFVRGRR